MCLSAPCIILLLPVPGETMHRGVCFGAWGCWANPAGVDPWCHTLFNALWNQTALGRGKEGGTAPSSSPPPSSSGWRAAAMPVLGPGSLHGGWNERPWWTWGAAFRDRNGDNPVWSNTSMTYTLEMCFVGTGGKSEAQSVLYLSRHNIRDFFSGETWGMENRLSTSLVVNWAGPGYGRWDVLVKWLACCLNVIKIFGVA